MNKIDKGNLFNIVILIICIPFLFGFSRDYLMEIEVALLNKDFASLNVSAITFLSSCSEKQENVKKQDCDLVEYYLALSYLYTGDYQKAKDILTSLKRIRNDADLEQKIYLGLMDTYFFQEDYQKALSLGDKFLEQWKSSAYLSLVYLKQAKVYLKLANWEKANMILKKITSGFPNSLEVEVANRLLEEKQYFAVQIGSFIERNSAEELVSDMRLKGYYAYIIESRGTKNKFYRVRVGKLAMLSEAKLLRNKLMDKGYQCQICP